MKRIGIITLIDYKNYGNRLQNYALQEVLKDLGAIPETIEILHNIKKKSVFSRLIRNLVTPNFIKNILRYYRNKKYSKYILQRIEGFRGFTSQYIIRSNFYISESFYPQDQLESYNYFITGSDQVWNPYFNFCSPIYFLEFAPPHKRIAYAPSFGIDSIPDIFVEKYTLWLSQINHISVRELAGAKIIRQLTGREAQVVLDPTMLLTKERWLSIAKKDEKKPKSEYLLAYFLGRVSKKNNKHIIQIAERYNLEIVRLADVNDIDRFTITPEEFLDYISSAKVICTDSFHGAVFAILFHIPFIVFDRDDSSPSMKSRLESLLKTFNLESRYFSEGLLNEQLFDIEFSKTDLILSREREKSLNFLRDSININN